MLTDIPEGLGGPAVGKASGVVNLPCHLDWSTPEAVYDLDDADTSVALTSTRAAGVDPCV